MSEVLKIKLKSSFREPLRSKIGFFGREVELSRLKAIFTSRTAATVLVSGHRGVGKSALVDEAIKAAATKGKKPLVARLTLPHIYTSENNVALREQILRGLARALHFEIVSEKAKVKEEYKERAEALYRKTYLKELREESILASRAKTQNAIRHVQGSEVKLQPDRTLGALIGSALGGIVGTLGIFAAVRVASTYGPWWGILSFVVIVGLAIASGVTITKTKTTELTEAEELEASDETTQTGVYDLSPETLEFELRTLIGELTNSGRPCIFIIDELDKLESLPSPAEGAHFEQHVIFSILSVLKNFFTLGSGIYVFIAGEDFYVKMSDHMVKNDYSLAHTLFTDSLFVHILNYQDIEKLIDALIDDKPADLVAYRQFRNYLCWESRNHVFDLLGLIEEYVTYDDGRPLLVAREVGERDGRLEQGNLPADWRELAGLQKYVGAAYDESFRPSAREQRFNQALWILLVDVARRLNEGESIDVPEEGYLLPTSEWLKGLKEQDRDDLSSAVERLVAKMERYGAAETSATNVTVPVPDSQPREVAATRYALVENPPYPPSSVGRTTELIKMESAFLTMSEKIARIATHVAQQSVDITSLKLTLNEVADLAKRIKGTTARATIRRSDTRLGIKKADDVGKALVELGIDGAIRKWASETGVNVSKVVDEVEPRTGQPWRAGLSEFADLLTVLDADKPDYCIIGGSKTENQLLVVNNWGNEELRELSDAYAKSLSGEKGRERRKQRLPILVINHVASGEIPDIPIEVVREVVKNSEDDFWLTDWFRTRISERKEKMAGWNTVVLDAELANLDALSKRMGEVSFVTVESTPSST